MRGGFPPVTRAQRLHQGASAGGGGGGGNLTHGSTFNVTGSGFGSKSGADHRWDDASGTSPSAIWTYAYPTTATSGNIAYRSAQRSVPLPHSNVSKYICANHEQNVLTAGRFIVLGVDFTTSTSLYSRWEWYHRLDPAWVFDTPASVNNHKWYGISKGSGSPYADGTNQWYLEFRGAGDFSSTSGSYQWHVNDDASGVGITHWGNNGFYSGQANPFTGWVKRTLLLRWDASASGLLYGEANYSVMANDTEMTDGYAGTARSEAIEGYAGNYDSNNWRYMADVYYDRGSNDAALYLTNNATWASATIKEVQPFGSTSNWTNTSITATCNKGQLSSGTVHMHIRSLVNGNQYLGTATMN